MLELRKYQFDAIERIRAELRCGKKRILFQLPTGGGKSLTAAAIVSGAVAKGNRGLVVGHRMELLDQMVSTFARLGITSLGVVRSGDKRRDSSQPIQIASIATLVRRKPPPANIVIIDEAHRTSAASYQKLFEWYPDAMFLGLTATPCRGDGKPLGQSYQAMVLGATYSQLIAQGFIVEPEVYSTPMQPDLSGVHTVAGEYNQEELEEAVNRGALIGNLFSEWSRRAGGRRTVVFAVSVEHSKAIVCEFVAGGVKAEHLDGATPEDERRAILARLESGETLVVSNVGVLCEGWDQPACKCLVLACPTKSLVRHMQMAGRVLRPWESLTPVILDHGGNIDRHDMPHVDREWSLDERVKKSSAPPQKCCPACFAYVPSALMVCPHCGAEFPRKAAPPVEERERLDEVGLALRTLDGDDGELRYFRQLARTARDRGWRVGAVNHRFQEKYGRLPPRHWYLRVKKLAGADAEWQRKIAWRAGA